MDTTDESVRSEGQVIGLRLDDETIAWPGGEGSTYRLYHAARGGMKRTGANVAGADRSVELTVKGGGLTEEQKRRDPYIAASYTPDGRDYTALRSSGKTDVAEILEGRATVMEVGPDGAPIASSSLQTARVLDLLYAATAKRRRHRMSFDGDVPTPSLWVPAVKSVALRLYVNGDVAMYEEHSMERQPDGPWTIEGDVSWAGRSYAYDAEVYIPPTLVAKEDASQQGLTGTVAHSLVTDPNSVGLTTDSKRSVVLDLDDPRCQPEPWRTNAAPAISNQAERSILEIHVCDFSTTDTTVPEWLRGTYSAFSVKGSHGMAYLRELVRAEMSAIHLLPAYDFGSVPENRATQATVDMPDSGATLQDQRAAVGKVAGIDAYNWGYDPFHYMTPEGSYVVKQYRDERTAEYRDMVGNLHAAGCQVVQDVVYDHTYAYGQDEGSMFEKIVPGYYHRLGCEGQTFTTPCCGEFATEHAMTEELMVNSLLTWTKAYKVDGFRFDLMEFNSVGTMKRIRTELDSLTLEKDGADGSQMYLYGEGRSFGTTADGSRFAPSVQETLGGTGIGTFSDRLRDVVRGSQFDGKNDTQGFENGLLTDPSGAAGGDADMLRPYIDVIRAGLAGNTGSIEVHAADGTLRKGSEVYFNGQVAGYGTQSTETANYADVHDNETLFDLNIWKMPGGSCMSDRVRVNTLPLATATLGQSPVFWHAETGLLCSKSMDRNPYNSGDRFNAVDWPGKESSFGVGLPPARDSSVRWKAMSSYMSDPADKPGRADVAVAYSQAFDLLKLCASTSLFTLGDAVSIRERASFPNSGLSATPDLLVMNIDDTKGKDRDGMLDGVLAIFNTSPRPITEKIEGMESKAYELSEVQAKGSDDVVEATTQDRVTGTVAIPACTVAVLALQATKADV